MAFLNEQGLQRLWQHIVIKLSNKVDSEEGKGLSTNDFTNEDKQKLEALNDVATTEYVDTKVEQLVTEAINTIRFASEVTF